MLSKTIKSAPTLEEVEEAENSRRADLGGQVIDDYRSATRSEDDTVLTDILTDLMHHAFEQHRCGDIRAVVYL